jgi:type II secretory pathway pseudopilin PulG
MSENKTGKYLKYAIGEIVLVVIGILIAIQLNEWRRDSSNNNQKQVVLKALQLEFQANLEQVDKVLLYIGKSPEIYPHVLEMIKNHEENYTMEDISNAIKNLSYTWSFNPNNGALRSAISSSQIHLLENNRLIELLFSWEDVVKDSEEESKRLRNYQYDSFSKLTEFVRIADIWGSEFPVMGSTNSPSDHKALLKGVFFEDYSARSYIYATEYFNELNIIKNQNKEILSLIKEELNEM